MSLEVTVLKNVEFEFRNIQSHEATTFSLHPGLNFILADDNNVGKSTIFKALTIIVRMPKVSSDDLKELLRVNETRGYVSLKFDNVQVVFWMIRDGDRVNAFFENHLESGEVIRLSSCPQCVLDALDIVVGRDGLPINFNDADSVQLIVQDTTKNDEVLSKVLIDLDVEHVKLNLETLDRQVVQDYNILRAKYDTNTHILSNMTYRDSADRFFQEKHFLQTLVSVVDAFEEVCGGLDNLSVKNLEVAETIYQVNDMLQMIHDTTFPCEICTSETINELQLVSTVLYYLDIITNELKRVGFRPIEARKVFDIRCASDALSALSRASMECERCDYAQRTYYKLQSELEVVKKELQDRYAIVKCPVLGDVYFGEEKCIPVSHRLTSGFSEGKQT